MGKLQIHRPKTSDQTPFQPGTRPFAPASAVRRTVQEPAAASEVAPQHAARGLEDATGYRVIDPLRAPQPRVPFPQPSAAVPTLQTKGDGSGSREEASAAQRLNKTGMPDNLKAGVESLSGMSLDDVKVHYNSAQPARLNALAYAQGSDIHVAPRQEQHLPHEAWHVVQQAQGRVKPTMQMKDGVPVNDDAGLEHEADVMGAKALAPAAQLAGGPEEEDLLQSAPAQRMEIARTDTVVQLGRSKTSSKKRKKKKKTVNTQYGSCTFDNNPLTVKTAVFFNRPPSNSRRGQGDHVVSYSLITHAVATSVGGKSLDQAGEDLAELVSAAKEFVGPGAINKWWHTNADSLIERLNGIDQGADEPAAKSSIRSGINGTLALLNMMPGTAMKNKKSTKGHGEGGAKGGLAQAEADVKKGKSLKGNVWVNVLNLFDGAADKSLMESPAKLESKLEWLMALFSRAAPTLFGLLESGDLTLIPETDLSQAANDKFGLVTGLEVSGVIENWIS